MPPDIYRSPADPSDYKCDGKDNCGSVVYACYCDEGDEAKAN